MLKKVASNTIAQLLAKFVGAGLTFLTTAIIIRLSGPAIFGDLTKSLVLIAVAFSAIDFGLNAAVVRDLAGSRNQARHMGDLISTRFLLSLLAVVLTNALVFALPGGYTPTLKSVFWLGSLAIIFQGIYTSVNAWFQYQENYWRSAASSIGGTLLGASLTAYYAFYDPTLANFLLATTLGYALMATLSLVLARGSFTITISLHRTALLIKGSLVLGAILLASITASKLDTIILGVYRSSAEVGQYGFSYRIFDVLLVFPVFIMNSLYPRLIKLDSAKARTLVRGALAPLGLFGLLLASLAWGISPMLLYIRPELTLSATVLRVLALFLPLFFLSAPLMWQLIAEKKEIKLLRIYVLAALLNLVLNLIFVPSSGALAAAMVTGATELFILLSLLYYSRN